MTLFSYVVARDYGFAPNPFGGFCTLATCKPDVRRHAQIGDWIVGTGSRKRRGYLVYTMQVAEAMTFSAYWADPRFQYKKPNLRASNKMAFGDNIYHHVDGAWVQLNSHHSFADGTPNDRNILKDTAADRVLVATKFAYWGASGPQIPENLRNYRGQDLTSHDLSIGRGYKKNFPVGMVSEFIDWFLALQVQGYLGRPLDWPRRLYS